MVEFKPSNEFAYHLTRWRNIFLSVREGTFILLSMYALVFEFQYRNNKTSVHEGLKTVGIIITPLHQGTYPC